ncbi:MAG: hypothetical protein H8D49_01400 [Dehalococcoidia bacterium]|nr:hypothetical protein [Dehalococcoidia bacterium]
MGKKRKYRDHEQFGANAPINWRNKTTSDAYLEGMSRIAPPNMTPREQRGKRFEERTDKPESAKWHHNWDLAMFGGTEVSPPPIEPKQMALEEMLNGVERIPHVKRR